jgi:hypothetical protein
MSDPGSYQKRYDNQRGFTLVELAIVVIIVIILIGALVYWLVPSGARPFLTPTVAGFPSGTQKVDVYGAFTRVPSVLGKDNFRVDFRLVAYPSGTQLTAIPATLPAGVVPLPNVTVTFKLGGTARLGSGVGGAALTATTNAQGVATLPIAAGGRSPPPATVTATVTLGGQTGTEVATINEVDPAASSQ